jgi:hypothetical protein
METPRGTGQRHSRDNAQHTNPKSPEPTTLTSGR